MVEKSCLDGKQLNRLANSLNFFAVFLSLLEAFFIYNARAISMKK